MQMTNPRARVLFVSHTARLTGPTISLMLLLKYLRAHYDVSVLLPGRGPFLDALSAEKIPCSSLKSLDKWSIASIFRLMRREGVDLVYGNTTNRSSRNALIAAKLARVPFICHVRAVADGRPRLHSFFLNFADRVIVVSQACLESWHGRIRGDKVRVVHNGIDADGQDTLVAQGLLRRELELSRKRLLLTNIGRLTCLKGQEYGVDVVAECVRRDIDAELLLVGEEQDSDYVNHLHTMVREKGLGKRIHFAGYRKDALSLLSLTDIYLHTSLEEAHPRVVLEAMSMKVPVVAFATGGVAETVSDGETGYLAPARDVCTMTDRVVSLASTPGLRVRMGDKGKRRVEARFSAARTAEMVSNIICETLAADRYPTG